MYEFLKCMVSSYVWADFSWQSLQQRTTIRMRSMRRTPPSPEATMINISNVVSTGTTEQKRVDQKKEILNIIYQHHFARHDDDVM